MNEEEVESALKTEGITTNLPCRKVIKMSGTNGITKIKIATCCKNNPIMISGCQLGCYS